MHRIAVIMFLVWVSASFGIVQEYIENTCPDDPTFGGKCHLVDKSINGSGCKTIDGVKICRSWWEKKYEYECDGTDRDALYATFLGQSYCRSVTVCKKWEDVSLDDGNVSCRVYLDTNRPGCANNPNKPECVADDCGDIKKKCKLEEYIYHGKLPDGANQETEYYCDPVSGKCGVKQIYGTAGVALGTYVYKCPKDVRKVCREYETKIKCPATCPDGTKVSCPDTSNQATCPDGTFVQCPEQTCNVVKVCKEKEKREYNTTEVKSCNAPRGYTEYRVKKNTQAESNYRNNPLCLEVSTEYKDTIRTFTFIGGWDADGGSKNCYYATGWESNCYQLEESSGSWSRCYSLLSDSTNLMNFIQNTYYSNDPAVRVISATIINTSGKSNLSGCFGADNDASDVRLTVEATIRTYYGIYRCYDNTVDVSKCSDISSDCTPQDNPNDISNLACSKFAKDVEDPNKTVCAEFSLQYECPTVAVKDECIKWETTQVCNGGIFPVKDVEVENKDFTSDFAKATALAQLTNELKHIWSGRYMRCDSGWWSNVFENPFEYFKQKLVGFIVSKLGGQFLSAAQTFVSDYLGQCTSPMYNDGTYAIETDPGAIAAVSKSVEGCMGEAAKLAWQDAGDNSQMQEFLMEAGIDPNNPAVSFLMSPYGQFALQVAVDIVSQTKKCNACNDRECAETHGQYDTYGLIKGGNCHYVENGCAWKIKLAGSKICLRKKYYYCCYDSTFARILVEQAYKQLGYSFAGGNCSALTFDDIKRLDFSQMDWSELQSYLERKIKGQIDPNIIQSKINDYFEGGDYGTQRFSGETPY